MKGRRGFLKLMGGAAAATAAAPVADSLAIDEIIGADMARFAGVGVDTIGRNALDVAGDWTAQSADALKLIAKFGGSMKAPPELAMSLTPEDRIKLAALDLRARRLGRLRSMSEAAREAYT